MVVVERLQGLARDKGRTAVQLAVAWVLAKGQTIVPVIGARKRTPLEESLGALNVKLSGAELARIEEALPPVAGTRYGEEPMKAFDSER